MREPITSASAQADRPVQGQGADNSLGETRASVPLLAGRATILLVIDDRGLRELLGRALDTAGFALRVATSGQEALEQITAEHLDLVIAGITTPSSDAFRMLARLQADSRARNIPQLFLGPPNESLNQLHLTPDTLLAESFDLAEILTQVRGKLDGLGTATHASIPSPRDDERRDVSVQGLAVERTPIGPLRIAIEMAKYIGSSLIGRSDVTMKISFEPASDQGDPDTAAQPAHRGLLPTVRVTREELRSAAHPTSRQLAPPASPDPSRPPNDFASRSADVPPTQPLATLPPNVLTDTVQPSTETSSSTQDAADTKG